MENDHKKVYINNAILLTVLTVSIASGSGGDKDGPCGLGLYAPPL